MAATLKGRAVIWSIKGVTFTAGIVSSSDPGFPQSVRFQRGSEKSEIKDDGGVIRTQVFHGFKKTLSITVVPAGAAALISDAITSINAHVPSPGTTIRIADDTVSGVGTGVGVLLSADYNLLSATQNRSVDGVATIDLELEQGDESNDLTTAVS